MAFLTAALEIPMWTQTACEALRSGHVLQIQYDGYTRDVEVHAVGFTKDDNPVMRVWQVAGGSASNEPSAGNFCVWTKPPAPSLHTSSRWLPGQATIPAIPS